MYWSALFVLKHIEHKNNFSQIVRGLAFWFTIGWKMLYVFELDITSTAKNGFRTNVWGIFLIYQMLKRNLDKYFKCFWTWHGSYCCTGFYICFRNFLSIGCLTFQQQSVLQEWIALTHVMNNDDNNNMITLIGVIWDFYNIIIAVREPRHTLPWMASWKTNAEVQMLVEANSKPHDIMIYTDGSVTRDWSGWGITVKQGARTVHEDSGAHRVTTSSLTMEVEAVTHAIQWLVSQHDARITHAVILTDSVNLLQKVESGMGCPDWHTAMHNLWLQRLLWIYCPGHAGVSGNERADRLASTADITSGLQLGRAEVLRGLRNFLNTDKPEHHSIDRLKEREVKKGSGRHSTLQGWKLSVFNQANIGTVSMATLGRLLRDGAERIWTFPSATMPSWAETETETETNKL